MVEIRISMFCLFGLLSVSFVEKTARERLTRGERLRGGKLCFVSREKKEKNLKMLVNFERWGDLKKENALVTALVPSDTACLANSPGKINRTDVWISLDVTVGFLLYRANLAASVAIFSKMSLMKEFMMLIALEEMPVSGCTCFKTL